MSFILFHALELTVWYLIGLTMLSNVLPWQCPPGCQCGCAEGGPCLCCATTCVAAAPDTIGDCERAAIAAGVNCVVRVGGMTCEGIPGAAGAMCCDVRAVEDCDGPCVYVGRFVNGEITGWTRYKPAPVQRVQYQPIRFMPPPPMWQGGGGMMGCGMGGC